MDVNVKLFGVYCNTEIAFIIEDQQKIIEL